MIISLQEENNSGTGRHMWVELPVKLDQAPFVPKKRDLDDILKEDGEDAYYEAVSKENVGIGHTD
jgi:hypothetical protein